MTEENAKSLAGNQDKPKARFRFLKLVPSFFVLLLVLGCSYLGFMFLEQEKAIEVLFEQQNVLGQQNSTQTQELLKLQNDLEAANTNTATVNENITEQKLEIEQLNRELISTRLRINDSGGGTNQVWTLEEAESLLRIAQQRLIVAKDTRSALALFVASDEILKQINDPAIFSIRNILVSEMAALRAVQEVDVGGIYIELGVLSQSIDSLQVSLGADREFGNSTETTIENEDVGFWKSVLNYLGTFVIVQKTNEVIPPLLSPEQNYNLKQNIQLQIEQAKTALLQGSESIYQQSIATALQNIERYLGPEGGQKQRLMSSLSRLHDVSIVVQIPVLSNSLAAIQQILPLREGQDLEASE